MPGIRDKIDHVEILVRIGWKKYVRYDEGYKLYGMSKRQFMRLALESGAVRRIGGDSIVNVNVLNRYIAEQSERVR